MTVYQSQRLLEVEHGHTQEARMRTQLHSAGALSVQRLQEEAEDRERVIKELAEQLHTGRRHSQLQLQHSAKELQQVNHTYTHAQICDGVWLLTSTWVRRGQLLSTAHLDTKLLHKCSTKIHMHSHTEMLHSIFQILPSTERYTFCSVEMPWPLIYMVLQLVLGLSGEQCGTVEELKDLL